MVFRSLSCRVRRSRFCRTSQSWTGREDLPQTSDQDSEANSGLLTLMQPWCKPARPLRRLSAFPDAAARPKPPCHLMAAAPGAWHCGIAHLPGEQHWNRCAEFLRKGPGSTNASTVSGVTSSMISFPSTYKRNSAELKARCDSIFISLERRVRAKGDGMLLIMLSLRMTTCHSPSRGSTQGDTSDDLDKKQAFSSSASGTDALALASSKNIKKQRLGPLARGKDKLTLSYAPVTVVTTTNRQGCELLRLPWNRRWSTGIGKVNEGSKAGHGSTTLSSRSAMAPGYV